MHKASALLSSKLFATAGTENHQHIHDTEGINEEKMRISSPGFFT